MGKFLPLSAGDVDGDGDVGFADFQTFEANFGNHLPEPATLGLLLLDVLTLVHRRRK